MLVLALVVVLAVAGAVVGVLRARTDPCPAAVPVADPRSPLLDADGMRAQPDERLDTLAAAVAAMPAPFGPVLAGVGFDYGQWLHLYDTGDGLLALTRNNAAFTLLDGSTLAPRWALRPPGTSTAWDSSAATGRLALIDLPDGGRPAVSVYSLTDGALRWCANVEGVHGAEDPVGTAFLPDGSLLTAFGTDGAVRLTRHEAGDGAVGWSRTLPGAARADFLAPLASGLVLAGGVEEFRLPERDLSAAGRAQLTAVDPATGETAWTWAPDRDALVHVAGATANVVVLVQVSTAGPELIGLDPASGAQLWRTTPRDAAFESAVRAGTVLMRSPGGLDGYDAETGEHRWHWDVPSDRTYFPYGFTLAQAPSLDAEHVLVPSTESLVVLDVRDGARRESALPTDGISTTYWPYQLVVTPDLLGVVTNIGGVVAARE